MANWISIENDRMWVRIGWLWAQAWNFMSLARVWLWPWEWPASKSSCFSFHCNARHQSFLQISYLVFQKGPPSNFWIWEVIKDKNYKRGPPNTFLNILWIHLCWELVTIIHNSCGSYKSKLWIYEVFIDCLLKKKWTITYKMSYWKKIDYVSDMEMFMKFTKHVKIGHDLLCDLQPSF